MRTPNAAISLLWTVALACAAGQGTDPLDQKFRPEVSAAGVPQNVWVTGAMAKVQPTAMPGPLRYADLAAARNEFESFQVHVRAGSAPIALNVTAGDFVDARTNSRIRAATNVTVFREGYLNVTKVSDLNGISGLVPDALIPAVDPYLHEARSAFPVTVPPNQTRSAWIDVFVPPGTPSGYYLGTITVTDGDALLAKVPVRLKVWNFDLPSTATLRTDFGLSYSRFATAVYGAPANFAQYPPARNARDNALPIMNAAIAAFFLDHRISVAEAVTRPWIPAEKWSPFDAIYGPLLNGQAKTILAGAKLTALDYANGGTVAPKPDDMKDWAAHFQAKGWMPILIHGLCDEPPAGCAWGKIAPAAEIYHKAAPQAKILVTTDIAQATEHHLLEAIDILTPIVGAMQPQNGPSRRAAYDEWLKRPGKELWWYQSCASHENCDDKLPPGPITSRWPSYMVDASGVRNRIFQWLAYLYGIQGELYYATDTWDDDPWDHLHFAGGNGDGALFYPGSVAQIGGKTPIPVASIRLKLIREGMEDFEYLTGLTKAGQGKLAVDVSHSFITSAAKFDDDPQALSAAREKLGTALHQLSLSHAR